MRAAWGGGPSNTRVLWSQVGRPSSVRSPRLPHRKWRGVRGGMGLQELGLGLWLGLGLELELG